MIRNCSIIVVGAGAAGMSATAKLLSHGFTNVTVLEASSRIGGRVNSTSFGPYTIDLGAQWVHGEKGNIVFEMANRAGEVSGSEFNVVDMLCANSSGHIVDINLSRQIYSVYYRIHEQFGDEKDLRGSFGDYFIQKFNSELAKDNIVISDELKQSFIENLQQFENSVDAADSWFETSAPGLQVYEECEGNPLVKWKQGGYNSVFKLIDDNFGVKGVTSSSRVQFGKEVTAIEWDDVNNKDNDKVIVRCSDGSHLTADHVIVAVSLGVLKHNVSASGAAAVFQPQLPSYKQIAIRALGFGTVDKIFVRFPSRWWPDDFKGFSFLWTSLDRESQEYEKRNLAWAKDVFGFFTVDDLPDVLCGWIVGKSARQMEAETEQTVLDVSHELLTRFFGNRFNIPQPTAIYRSKWYSNPFTRGSYSFRTVDSYNVNTSAVQLSQPVANKLGKQVLFFAGEATHPYFYSTVHGAVETGLREADRIASMYSLKEKLPDEKKSVVVVGAGIAGLAACKTLIDHGITDIVLLEAQDHAGGRIMSVPIQDGGGGGWAELGAQWIHGEENVVHAIASARHLVSDHVSAEGLGKYLYLDGEEVPQKVVHEVEGVVGYILEECENFCSDNEDCPPLSVGHYLCEKFQKYLDECQDSPQLCQTKMDLFDWHIRFQVIDNSCDNLNELSAKFWGCYKFSGGRDYVNFKNGYSSLIDTLVQDLPSNLLQLNCAVRKIVLETKNDSRNNCSSQREGDESVIKSYESMIKSDKNKLKSDPMKIVESMIQSNENMIQSDESMIQSDGNMIQSEENMIQSDENMIQSEESMIQSDENMIQSEESMIQSEESMIQSDESRLENYLSMIKSDKNKLKSDEHMIKIDENRKCDENRLESDGKMMESILRNDESMIKNEESLLESDERLLESDNRTLWPVTVVCENGEQFMTSHVIVTSSLGYLKRHHETLFSPSLPDGLIKAIETMGFNVINKIFLIYEQPWWSADEKGFQIMWRGKENSSLNHKEYWVQSLTGFDVLSNFDSVLLGWVGGEGAIEMESLTEEEIGRQCTMLLAKITQRNDLPKPAQVIRSQWHSNRFVCGGYSHTTSQCDQRTGPQSLQHPVMVESALSNQHPAILLAGEATHEKFFSTTHGAYESGVSQANKIISFINQEIKKV